MKLPNFIVAGFPKCGSTSLHYYFNEHPEIFMPPQKELHYFTYDILKELNAGKGDKESKKFHIGTYKEYKACYKEANGEIAIGDVSPSYANYAAAIPKIDRTLGSSVKIIIVVRDPIERAYSNYLHLVREDREQLCFYEALLQEKKRKLEGYSDFWYYTFNSLYAEKIERLKNHFTDVLVVTFEDFVSNKEERIKEIYGFLEVRSDFLPNNLDTQYNPGGVYKQNAITKFIFRQSKLKSFVKRVIPLTPSLKKVKLKTIQRYKEPTPQIDPKAEAFLVDIFREDVSKLRIYGVKTEYWNDKLSII